MMNIEKEARAIQYLKMFEPESKPYYACYSGGKDSDVIRILLSLAGVKHELHHNLTTVDAPETVWYVKSIPEVIIDRPEKNMFSLIVEKMFPPTRLARYCCERLKEHGGAGRLKVTGVRWAESTARKDNSGFVKIIGKPVTVIKTAEGIGANFILTNKGGVVLNDDNTATRQVVERCYRTTSTMINPIVDWTDADVWEFLRHYNCRSNPLYECGYKRVGCVGCPLGGYAAQKLAFLRYPKYRALYVRAFDKMLEARKAHGLENRITWRNGEDVMTWWTGGDVLQISIDDYLDEIERVDE